MSNVIQPELITQQELRDLALRNAVRARDPERFEYAEVLGVRVRQARQERGISRPDLALKSGVGDRLIRLLEHGLLRTEEVEDEMIQALATALQIEEAVLFYGVEDEAGQTSVQTDWGEVLRDWRLGVLRHVRGVWEWTPHPASGLVRVSRSRHRKEPQHQPKVELPDPHRNVARVEAGTEFAGETLVLLQVREDRSGYDLIDEVKLDEEGQCEIELPGGEFPVHLALVSAGRKNTDDQSHN